MIIEHRLAVLSQIYKSNIFYVESLINFGKMTLAAFACIKIELCVLKGLNSVVCTSEDRVREKDGIFCYKVALLVFFISIKHLFHRSEKSKDKSRGWTILLQLERRQGKQNIFFSYFLWIFFNAQDIKGYLCISFLLGYFICSRCD